VIGVSSPGLLALSIFTPFPLFLLAIPAFSTFLFFFIKMKLFKSTHDYNYEWSLVSAAQWQKYPNENCPHVSHVDVLNRTIDPETGILTTERLITVNQNIPTIIKKVSTIQ
jgi:hypothetical protein